jgi:hypothetical protein
MRLLLLPIVFFISLNSSPVLAVDAGDVATLKKVLAAASAWSGSDQKARGFDPAMRRQLDELAGQVADPALRTQARKLVVDLEPVCVLQVRVRFLLGEVKRLKGKSVTEPGGPQWLTKLVGPEAMGVFTRLTEIDLNEHTDGHAEKKPRPKGEAVTDAWLGNLADLPDLTRLEISGTSISDTGLAPLRNLKSLERLNICLTPLTDACLKHLAGLTNLRRLVICSTRVTGSGFKDIPDWPKIESINLHSCAVSDEGLAAISRFKNLQRLEIVHSRVTDAGLKHLGKLTNLRQLHVASHGTTRHGLGFVENLTLLYQLDLYEELASNEGLAHTGKLTNLKILNLYVGPADDAGLAPLRKLTHLEELTIGGLGKVTDAAVDHLVGLKTLKKLTVNGTKITEAGIKRLREALPATQIGK